MTSHDEDAGSTSISVASGELTSRGGIYTYDAPSFRLSSLLLDKPVIGQRYRIEIWVEKSTMDDVLEPLAHRGGVPWPCRLLVGLLLRPA